MDRIDDTTAEQNKFGAGKHGWTNGDPADPDSGTIGQEEWFDGVQEEIVGVIEAAGLTPSSVDFTQLRSALLLAIGDTMTGTLAFNMDDELPRVSEASTLPSLDKRLWLQSGALRLYASTQFYSLTHNVSWDNTANEWVSEGSNESVISFDPVIGAIVTNRGTLTSGSFAETSILYLDKTVPATPTSHTQYPVCVSKAVGRISVTGGVEAIEAGSLGIEDAVEGSSLITVTLDQPMTGNYFIQLTNALTSRNDIYSATVTGPDTFIVQIRDADSGSTIDAGATDVAFYVDVKGTHV